MNQLHTSQSLLTSLRGRLAAYRPPDNLHIGSLGRAAVLLPIVSRPSKPLSLIFCIRASSLRNHAGQVCFPGGRRDPPDVSDLHCALRETKEEIGIDHSQVEILGKVDQIVSMAGLLVTPFVGVINAEDDWKAFPTSEETEEVFEVEFKDLLEMFPDAMNKRSILTGRKRVWGLTFEMLARFLQIGFDKPVKPEHYDIIWERIPGDADSRQKLSWMSMAQQFTPEDQKNRTLRLYSTKHKL